MKYRYTSVVPESHHIPWNGNIGFHRALCNMGYPFEMHFKIKSHENPFVHNLFVIHLIILNLCTDHNDIMVVICKNFQHNQINVTDKL